MDYSIVLSEISVNQLEILNLLKLINNSLGCLVFVFVLFVLTMYIMIIIKH